jgi:hypothetical protein
MTADTCWVVSRQYPRSARQPIFVTRSRERAEAFRQEQRAEAPPHVRFFVDRQPAENYRYVLAEEAGR